MDSPIRTDFDAWYGDAHPRVLATLVLALGDIDRASDATDEAFVRCFSRWDRVSALESPIAWTIRVAINVGRRRARRANLEARLLRRVALRNHVPAAAGEAWHVVSELPDRQREVLVLRYVADLTERDIATSLGVSRSAVSSALTDARRNLSRRFAETDDGGPMSSARSVVSDAGEPGPDRPKPTFSSARTTASRRGQLSPEGLS